MMNSDSFAAISIRGDLSGSIYKQRFDEESVQLFRELGYLM